MQNNRRVRYTFIFAASGLDYSAVLKFIAPKLSEQFAGACCNPIDGVWAEDGSEFKSAYSQGCVEDGMKIEVSVPVADRQSAYAFLKRLLGLVEKEFILGINWVHVEVEEIEVAHFSLRNEKSLT